MPNFECFENYYSSRFQRQICYNLGEKIISRSDVNKNADVGVWRERNWQTSGKKNITNSAFERQILLPYF